MEKGNATQTNEKEQNIKLLKQIICDFENERWLKMATRTNLATYIVEKGFHPSTDVAYYKCAIAKVIKELIDLLEQSDNCGISTQETQNIIDMLKSI